MGFSALTASGSPEARLVGWITGAHRAVLSALMLLERLAQWRARAEAETADLQGRTPARLIAALAAHPILAAPQAELETGASRAAVQRNLDVLVARGLVREVSFCFAPLVLSDGPAAPVPAHPELPGRSEAQPLGPIEIAVGQVTIRLGGATTATRIAEIVRAIGPSS